MQKDILNWLLNIGNLSIVEWFTVFGYFLRFYVSIVVYAQCSTLSALPNQRHQKNFWLGLAIMLFILGVNRILDLQALFSNLGRDYAFQSGWYAKRRVFQFIAIIIIVFAAIELLKRLIVFMKDSLEELWLVILASIYLLAFTLIRAISLHYVDSLIYRKIFYIRINWLLEFSGIIMVIIPAYKQMLKYRKMD